MNNAIEKHTKQIRNHVTHVEDADYDEIISPNSLFFDILKVSGCLVTIFNLHRFNYVYIDPQFHELLGPSFPETPGSPSNASFYDLVHPDDLYNLTLSDRNGYKRFHLLPHSEREDYTMTCQFRIRSVTGKYICVYRRIQPLKYDKKNNLWMIYCFFNILPKKFDHEAQEAWLINKKKLTKESLLGNQSTIKAERIVTEYPLKIMQLINDGLTTDEIAEKQFTSKNTIYNQRHSALKYTNSNSSELASYKLRLLGLLKIWILFLFQLTDWC
jgi:DNA-binding CsgD family transcriptional regulator/PAS domain-containing protein